jgi:hypothetical protein
MRYLPLFVALAGVVIIAVGLGQYYAGIGLIVCMAGVTLVMPLWAMGEVCKELQRENMALREAENQPGNGQAIMQERGDKHAQRN